MRQRLFGPLLDDPPPFAFAPSVLAPSYCAGLLDRADDERPRLTTTRDSDDPPPPPQTSLACGTPASSDVLSMSKVPCATFRLSAGADARRHWMRALLTTRTFVRASRACRRCLLRAWSAVPAKCMLQGTEAVLKKKWFVVPEVSNFLATIVVVLFPRNWSRIFASIVSELKAPQLRNLSPNTTKPQPVLNLHAPERNAPSMMGVLQGLLHQWPAVLGLGAVLVGIGLLLAAYAHAKPEQRLVWPKRDTGLTLCDQIRITPPGRPRKIPKARRTLRQVEDEILRRSEELVSSQTLLAQARHHEAELSKRVSDLSQKIHRLSKSYKNLDFLGSVFCARREASRRVSFQHQTFGDTHRNEVFTFGEQPDTVVVLSQAP